jgi:hypothetical protein
MEVVMRAAASKHRFPKISVRSGAAPAALLAAILLAFASAPVRSECSPAATEVDARCYPGNLQAAVNDALASDLPLLLPHGTYPISAPLVIDYAANAGGGFELISRGARIDATAVATGPALEIICSGGNPSNPKGCFYFHQEGTLFVDAASNGYAVVIGQPDFSDAQNSIKIDHLIVNNSGASAIQLNYVLGSDLFLVGNAAGDGTGIALEQVQFSTIHGAASANQGTALALENGYIFANTIQGMDLEASSVCLRYASATAMGNAFVAPYLNCPLVLQATTASVSANRPPVIDWVSGLFGGAVTQTFQWLN